jgi:hypothetical protein
MKHMEIKEFIESGYLQEANRQFFHPLGLALVIKEDKMLGIVSISGVWDCRDDPEGIYFGIKEQDDSEFQEMKRKEDFVRGEMYTRFPVRKNKLGFVIEPVVIAKDEETT